MEGLSFPSLHPSCPAWGVSSQLLVCSSSFLVSVWEEDLSDSLLSSPLLVSLSPTSPLHFLKKMLFSSPSSSHFVSSSSLWRTSHCPSPHCYSSFIASSDIDVFCSSSPFTSSSHFFITCLRIFLLIPPPPSPPPVFIVFLSSPYYDHTPLPPPLPWKLFLFGSFSSLFFSLSHPSSDVFFMVYLPSFCSPPLLFSYMWLARHLL